jgi:glycosyltransferase involved in cell wall biosynthesis
MTVSKYRRLRVIFFIPNLAGGGAERVLINLLKHLDRTQFDPHLVVSRSDGPHANSVPTDVLVTELASRNLWTVTPKLANAIRHLKPDVVVATTGGCGIPTVLAHRVARSRARLIVWERSVLVGSGRGVKRRLLLNLKKILWPRVDLVTAVGTMVEEDIRRQTGLDQSKTRVLYSPILDQDLEHLGKMEVAHRWFGEYVPIILCVARLVPLKDHETLLRGFARLLEEREVRLVLLGDGPLRRELEHLAEQLGISRSVWFAGFVKNPFKYMRRSSLLALTSLHEGMPGVVVQAMACGLPVVGTASPGGTPEIVQHEQTGLLIPMKDPDAFFEAACRLLDEPGFARQLADKAREYVTRFEVNTTIAAYENSLVGDAEKNQ